MSNAAVLALRLWKRRLKKRYRLQRSSVVLVSYPKSGRTWLVTMLSHALHRRFGTPADELLLFDNFHRHDPRIPIFFPTADNVLGRPSRDEEAVQLYRGKRVVLLLRDPRDVAVSFYHHITRRSTALERALFGVEPHHLQLPLDRFVLDETVGLPRVIDFHNRWVRRRETLPARFLTLYYEELRARPLAELQRLAAFLELPLGQAELEAAVDFAAFERLKERERRGFFRSERLRPGRVEDADSYKVRRGQVGGYRQEVAPEVAARMDALTAARLDPRLPYAAASATAPADQRSARSSQAAV